MGRLGIRLVEEFEAIGLARRLYKLLTKGLGEGAGVKSWSDPSVVELCDGCSGIRRF